MNFTMNFTTRSARTLGSSTEGEGSERYQIVKKMVIAGALSGSHNSLRYSGLFIGTATASKYRAALIRDGVIRAKKDSQQNTCNNKQTPEIILGDEISERKMFEDFREFAESSRVRHINKMNESKSEREKRYHATMLNQYNSMVILLDQFDVNIVGYAKRYSYRTGYLVEKGRATIEENSSVTHSSMVRGLKF